MPIIRGVNWTVGMLAKHLPTGEIRRVTGVSPGGNLQFGQVIKTSKGDFYGAHATECYYVWESRLE